MRRLFAFLIGLLLAVGSAEAATCTCTSTCDLSTNTNWSCAAIPGTADDVVCGVGGTITIPAGTYTTNNFWSKPGCVAVNVTGTVVWNFNGPLLTINGFDSGLFFMVGDASDDRGVFTSNGQDLTINWAGAGVAYAAFGPHLNSFTDNTTTNYTAVTLRGKERFSGAVLTYSRGATAPTPDTNMVDCLDGMNAAGVATAPTGGAPGDTIWFTTGKSQEFPYEVTCYPDQCTGAGAPFACCSAADATTECSAVACNGGPCDYQITRNSTGSTPGSVASSPSWSETVFATQNAPFGAGGAALQATPFDSDANGVANGDGTLPQIGDKFVVYKPVLIQGGTDPTANGIVVWAMTGGVDLKYVEFAKLGANLDGNCDAALTSGHPPIWFGGTKILSAEGALEFINIHNFASRQSTWEESYTDDPNDVKPNQPHTYRHVYIHDFDAQAATDCAAAGIQTAGRAIVFGIDTGTRTYDGVTFEGLHVARWGDGAAIDAGQDLAMANRAKRIVFRDTIAHDWPGVNGYGTGGGATNMAIGTQTLFDGGSIWNCGQNGRGCNVFTGGQGGVQNDGTITTYRGDNWFIVNIDTNTGGEGGGSPTIGGVFMPGGGTVSETTRGAVLSNSYAKGIVGAFSWGGITRFNFIKDVDFEDDAAAPCAAPNRRSAVHEPVEATGNVITRSAALSCMDSAIAMNHGGSASAFTDQTRKVVSNLMFNMDTDAAAPIAGIYIVDAGTDPTRNVDAYHNIIDLRNNLGNSSTSGGIVWGGGTYLGTFTAFYNTIMYLNAAELFGTGIQDFPSGTLNEGYNRFIGIGPTPAVSGGLGTGDVDSDLADDFVDTWAGTYFQKCEAPDKARTPWGGPVGPLRFGINSFNHFHPAVLPLMDTDAFRLRYNWTSCGAYQQDALPR